MRFRIPGVKLKCKSSKEKKKHNNKLCVIIKAYRLTDLHRRVCLGVMGSQLQRFNRG